MLSNTKYYGTAVIYKTHAPEYRAKRRVNDGDIDQYAAKDNNEPIITEKFSIRFKQNALAAAMLRLEQTV